MIDYELIKLVVWDLDDTFWSGTLSEGEIIPIERNISLIKKLSSMGIINSICSKNNYEEVFAKLEELEIAQYFVFSSINWEPKGKRLSRLIRNMGLRPANVLFIDDNIQNLKEAQYYEDKLMVALPSAIDDLWEWSAHKEDADADCSRLEQYRLLEKKHKAKEESSSNLDFLYDSNTRVEICSDCALQIDRIYELIKRTNQLNYTKLRSSIEELEQIIADDNYQKGYVTVKDKYGDYGIVGFYACKDNTLVHFLFSCRTIGQGIEQFVYAYLGYPKLSVVGEVVQNVDLSPAPAWINQDISSHEDEKLQGNEKIVIKGACDLDIMASFLSSSNIVTEFAYNGEKNNRIEHHSHSLNILQWRSIEDSTKAYLLNTCIFNDKDMYETSMFDEDVSMVFLSSQIEPNLGCYQNKHEPKLKIAFAEWCYPLTDQRNWDAYIKGSVCTYGNNFTEDWLKTFSENWEFIGRITVDEYIENLKTLLTLVNKQCKLCILLGSEVPYEANQQLAYENRHEVYKKYNLAIKKLAELEPRILTINFGDFINSQDDYLDNINHYQRRVYYEAAKIASNYIARYSQAKVKNNFVRYCIQNIIAWFISNVNNNGAIYKTARFIYRLFRK